MDRKQIIMSFPHFLLIAALLLSGCSTLIEPVTTSGTAPTPVISVIQGGVDNPDVYVDPDEFKHALRAAIGARDTEKLELWMTEPFLTGTWRADLAETSPQDALQALYAGELGPDRQLALAADVDLKALMGGRDPLSMPGAEAGVIEAALISGWGLTGLDEAVLFIARRPDNSLAWHGWLRIPGGFSGARFGGVKVYQNDALGFSVYLPKDDQVEANSDLNISITAPAVEGAGHPGGASIVVEPANGRTAETAARQVYADVKEASGKYAIVAIHSMEMDGTTAYVVTGIPSQSMMRQLFLVHNDLLYRLYFYPDEPQQAPVSYTQMENLYAMITNTFHFTR